MVTICRKWQILFSGKNKENVTNLSSAELTQRVVKVNMNTEINTGIENDYVLKIATSLIVYVNNISESDYRSNFRTSLIKE